MRRAIILAGGKGERLRPLTGDRPKAMIEVMGTPIMAFQLHWLRSYGVTRAVVECGYQHEVIESYFGDGAKWGVDLEYLVETEPLGRGGGLKRALRHLGAIAQPVVALNGDLLTNLELDDLFSFHSQYEPLVTIVTVPLRSPFGILEIAGDGTVLGFREKPELPYGINAGIYVLDPAVAELLPDKGDHEELTFPELARQRRMKAYQSRAFWRTVDTVKDVTELRKELEAIFLNALFGSVPAPEPTR